MNFLAFMKCFRLCYCRIGGPFSLKFSFMPLQEGEACSMLPFEVLSAVFSFWASLIIVLDFLQACQNSFLGIV